jgi:hypothetical protein
MPLSRPIGALAFLLALTSPGVLPAASGMAENSAAADLAREQRVAGIAYRLARAAAGLCAAQAPMTGMVLHDLASYAQADRATISQFYHLHSGIGIRLVVPAGAAARAGLRAGDEIVGLNDRPVTALLPEPIGREASPARVDHFEKLLNAALQSRPATLTIQRDHGALSLVLVGEPGCGGQAVVELDRVPDAWSDGAGVAVTAGLVDLAGDDDQLAFVLAHEMSHNILHHAEVAAQHSAGLAMLGIGAREIKASEIAADREAVLLMRLAHYDPAAAETMLRKLSAARGPMLATTHPGLSRRVALLHAEIANPGAPSSGGFSADRATIGDRQ